METHDPRAHYHHGSSDRLLFGVFDEAAVQHVTHVEFVELYERISVMGKDPPHFSIFSYGAVVSALQPLK